MARTVRSLQKSGIKARKGRVGKRAQYWTRTRVLRKLQVSLKDFRRLCILKGIFPREPPKGKDKSKIYYHAKDIKYLGHEQLIDKFRAVKVWMKRRARLMGRHEGEEVDKLDKPILKLDHLVRERYPSITDALRDLDDPLSLLHLFHTLRVRVHKTFTEDDAQIVARLINEFRQYIITQQCLRKVFVSIKGYYFQANIKGQLVTWLVPHQAMQKTPQNVDYSVMTTFLRFYETMLRCVNFKLYKEIGIAYPPQIDTEEEASKKLTQFAQPIVSQNGKNNTKSNIATTTTPATVSNNNKKGTQVAANVMKNALSKQKAATKKSMDDENDNESDSDDENKVSNDDNKEFQELDPSMQLTDLDGEASKQTFSNCVILVGRETAFEQISLVIRSGGGIALHETAIPSDYVSSTKITHQVVDRPKINGDKYIGRQYIQPQWIFDSFNMRQTLPTAPYAPGQALPPHLSPFIDDEKESYVPDQRNQLRAWVGLPPLKQSVIDKIRLTEEQQQKLNDKNDEDNYQAELTKELKQKNAKAELLIAQQNKKNEKAAAVANAEKKNKQQVSKKLPTQLSDNESEVELDMDMGDDDDDDMSDDDDMDDDVSDDDFDEENFMASDDSDLDDEEKKILNKPKAVIRPKESTRSDKDISRIMMNKKDSRLHSRIMYGKGRQEEQAKVLAAKRDAAAAGVENPTLPKRNFRPQRQR